MIKSTNLVGKRGQNNHICNYTNVSHFSWVSILQRFNFQGIHNSMGVFFYKIFFAFVQAFLMIIYFMGEECDLLRNAIFNYCR
jgi:hypothetical protein